MLLAQHCRSMSRRASRFSPQSPAHQAELNLIFSTHHVRNVETISAPNKSHLKFNKPRQAVHNLDLRGQDPSALELQRILENCQKDAGSWAIDLSGCRSMGSKGLGVLLHSISPSSCRHIRVRSLVLSCCAIDSSGFQLLSAFLHTSVHLRELNLSHNQLSAIALRYRRFLSFPNS